MLKIYRNVMFDLKSYDSPKSKLTQMIKKGEIIRIARGVYTDSYDDPRFPVANLLYSPSYISFETALAYHNMIPERVYAIRVLVFDLTKIKFLTLSLGSIAFTIFQSIFFHLL